MIYDCKNCGETLSQLSSVPHLAATATRLASPSGVFELLAPDPCVCASVSVCVVCAKCAIN